MKNVIVVCVLLSLLSCNNDVDTELDNNNLSDYITINSDLEITDLIACAGGREEGLFNNVDEPTSVFFYPVNNASDFRYFESDILSDSIDYSNYTAKELTSEPVFNGYLWRFNNIPFEGERMGIVTYRTSGKLHVCNPIRLKTNVKPTEINAELGEVIESGVNPMFSWEDGIVAENDIYFQVISDSEGNLVSGTYTLEKNFTFYDLSNVVLNITDTLVTPVLNPGENYTFTMMGVSEDNWVNLFIEKAFSAN